MPNWCSTSLSIYSTSHSEVKSLHDKLLEVIEKPFDGNVQAANWLGNMCMHAGYTYEETIAEKAGYCRGWIQEVTNIKTNIAEGIYYFYVFVEDAWGPHIQPFRASINKLYPNNSLKIAWIANECGCQIYQKFDDSGLFFSDEEYCMDCYAPDNSVYEKYPEFREGCEDYTAGQLMDIFALPDMESVIKRAEKITEAMEDEYGEGYIYINRYEEVDSEF